MKWVRIVAGMLVRLASVAPFVDWLVPLEPLRGALFVGGLVLEPIASLVSWAAEDKEQNA